MHSSKIYPKNHEIMHEIMKNNAKERVIWTYWLVERETMQEIRRKTTKKFAVELCRVGEREKVYEKVV